jgi:precorrin isomerase
MTKFIIEESFAVIDAGVGDHNFSLPEYAIVQQIMHSTALLVI